MTRAVCFFIAALFPLAVLAQQAAPAATRAAVTTTASPEVAAFQKIEDSWAESINARDQYGLELVLSPLFVGVSAAGEVTTRNQQVAEMISGDDKTIHLDQKVITVRMLGDVAVANGTYTLHHRVAAGPVDEKGVFTHVFERVRGNWLCINSQRTAVREETPGKAKKKSGSQAEEPFHIPFFTKDKSN
ncbi:MAG TPA: nuclear transport factor 2 family protein [Terracidiphilus sp.]|jgi:ketosteroid isomerase-like protein|nr:nuclear transport factor 2 family protein [Terracidiphilus sp.]